VLCYICCKPKRAGGLGEDNGSTSFSLILQPEAMHASEASDEFYGDDDNDEAIVTQSVYPSSGQYQNSRLGMRIREPLMIALLFRFP